MKEIEFLTTVLNEVRQISKSLITSLPFQSGDSPVDRKINNTKNTQYFIDKFPVKVSIKLNELLASFKEINGVDVSGQTKEKAVNFTRSLLNNYSKSILRGTSKELIPDYGKEE